MARLDPFDRPVAVRRGVIGEGPVYLDRARRLGLSFAPFVDLGVGAIADVAAIHTAVFAMSREAERLTYIAPDEPALPDVLRWLDAHPDARARLRVSTPSAIRAALVKAAGVNLADDAVERLASLHPRLSARRVATLGQIGVALSLLVFAIVSAAFAPVPTLVTINLIGATFFFGVTALRLVAAQYARERPSFVETPRARAADLPVYTILVPLYQEAQLVPDLVAALEAIDWPGIMAQTPVVAP